MSKFKIGLFMSIVMIIAVIVPMAVSAQAPETIVYNSMHGDPEPRAFDEKLVAMWNEANPLMPVEHTILAHEDFKQAIRAYLTADSPPDVLTWFAGNRARFFIDSGQIADISDMWAENNYDELYAPGFNAMATVDGKQYFIPTSYYWWAVYYRPSMFEEVGLEAPIETWDELLNACDVLNAAGYAPFTIGTQYRWTWAAWFDYINMRVNGPQFHQDLMLLKESYLDERVKAVFDTWAQLAEHDCFIDDPAAYTWQTALDFMIQGEAAMYLMGAFITDSYPDELEEDLDFFRFPVINPDVPIGEDAPTDGYFMAANAGNMEGGKQFLAFLGSQEVAQMRFDERGDLPTRVDVDLSNASESRKKGINLIQTADYILQFYDRDTTPPMADVGMNGFMTFWDDPSSAETVMQTLETERLRILEEGVTDE